MSLARRNFQRIWKQDASILGAKSQPAPRFKMVGKGQGYTTTGSVDDQWGAPRIINIGPNARRALKRYDPKSGKDPSGIRFAIEHELGRYLGPDAPLTSPDGNAGAGLANAVANHLAHFRNTGKGNPKKYNRTHLAYFGQNPRSVRWPSS